MLQTAALMMRGRRRSGAPTPPTAATAASRSFLWVTILSLCLLLNSSPPAAARFNWTRSASSHQSSHLPGIELPNHLSFNSVTSSHKSGCQHLRPAAAAAVSPIHKKEGRGDDHHHHNRDDDDEEVEEEGPRIDSQDVPLAGGPRPASPSAALKLHLKHRFAASDDSTGKSRKQTVVESTHRDLSRIQTLHRRITEKKNKSTLSRLTNRQHHRHQKHRPVGSSSQGGLESDKMKMPTTPPEYAGRLMATLESGVTLGSGEYFMDVFVGTPPRHFSLILDTGSDLNWIQCLPCHECFEQRGPHYDPSQSSSYRNVTCGDPRCRLVSSPDPPQPCRSDDQPCPYFYWYGDRSNTTGDLALETFTVNLTAPESDGVGTEFRGVENVIFGCGHWNRGLFHGAAGLLGLGRGPLSFSSQLQSLYGHTFSYCLVDRNSDLSVSSKLIFGEDQSLMSHPNLNFTSFTAGKENPADTFYYVQIKGITVGGELLTTIPPETWELSGEGAGGTIIDSGTTLSYFADPAYRVIKEAFTRKVKHYPPVEDFPILNPCYNVSGVVGKVELPEFAIVFGDGAVWNFPVENYFIRLEPEAVVCLAILGTPRSSLSILGNYQQQNFHIMYDTKNSRLGFAPMRCAEL